MSRMNKLPIAARAKIFSMLSKGVSMRSDIARQRLSRPAPLTNGSNVGIGYLRRVIFDEHREFAGIVDRWSDRGCVRGGALHARQERTLGTQGRRSLVADGRRPCAT